MGVKEHNDNGSDFTTQSLTQECQARGEGEKFSWPIGMLWIIKVIGLISSITLIWPRNTAIWWKETKEGGTN